MKGKILCSAGCQNSFSRITEAKEILKNPRPAGSWRPLKCIFSGKEKRPPIASRKPCPVRSMYGKNRQGQSAAVTEQVSTTVPKSAILRFCPSRETCWGVPSPNPALPLRGKEKRLNRICKQYVNFSKRGVRFLPIFLEAYEEVFTRARYMGAETERK